MRIVALEEHYLFPDLAERVDPAAIVRRGMPAPGSPAAALAPRALLADLGKDRIADMDASGISFEILSQSGAGADLLEPKEAMPLAKEFNDRLATAIRERPDRYGGFAHLPMAAPEAAADELERTVRDLKFLGAMVNGVTDGRFLDDPRFEPLLARAEKARRAHLHPPRLSAARGARGLLRQPADAGDERHAGARRLGLAPGGRGPCAAPCAVGRARPASQAEDHHRPHGRRPAGHDGALRSDAWPRRPARICSAASAPRSSTRCGSRPSGFFSIAPFMAALLTFGTDRILFSVDYPFSKHKDGRAFLDSLPVSRGRSAKRSRTAMRTSY